MDERQPAEQSLINTECENAVIAQWGSDLIKNWTEKWGERVIKDNLFRGALLAICLVRETRASVVRHELQPKEVDRQRSDVPVF